MRVPIPTLLILSFHVAAFGAEVRPESRIAELLRAGDYVAAQSLAEALVKQPASPADTVNRLYILGFTGNNLGRYEASSKTLQSALDLYAASNLAVPELLANILTALAEAYANAGNVKAAELNLRKAMRFAALGLPETSPSRAAVHDMAGSIFWYTGAISRAETEFKEALRLLAISRGEEHPDYAAELRQLGSFYHFSKQPEQAAAVLTRASQLSHKTIGAAHPDTIWVDFLLAMTRSEASPKEAIASIEALLPHLPVAAGGNHPRTGIVFNGLATAAFRAGDWKLAVQSNERALAIFKRDGIPSFLPEYVSSLDLQVVLLRKVGRKKDAATCKKEAERLREQYGEQSPSRHMVDIQTLRRR